ncbi:replication initiation and membrane attachment protein DnaB [Sporosarcina luteola]|nr:replication initiation and membrane attachment protein DnaB [Sporosarcina luteola]
MTKANKARNKLHPKVVHGMTPEERFQEIHGMTIEEWSEQQFKAKTGVTPEEWYLKKVKSTTPFDFMKERSGSITEDDVKLIKDLQLLGLKDGVINVLLDYVSIFSKIGKVHPLVRRMGENWKKGNILTVEKAMVFVREEHKKYLESAKM